LPRCFAKWISRGARRDFCIFPHENLFVGALKLKREIVFLSHYTFASRYENSSCFSTVLFALCLEYCFHCRKYCKLHLFIKNESTKWHCPTFDENGMRSAYDEEIFRENFLTKYFVTKYRHICNLRIYDVFLFLWQLELYIAREKCLIFIAITMVK